MLQSVFTVKFQALTWVLWNGSNRNRQVKKNPFTLIYSSQNGSGHTLFCIHSFAVKAHQHPSLLEYISLETWMWLSCLLFDIRIIQSEKILCLTWKQNDWFVETPGCDPVSTVGMRWGKLRDEEILLKYYLNVLFCFYIQNAVGLVPGLKTVSLLQAQFEIFRFKNSYLTVILALIEKWDNISAPHRPACVNISIKI